MKPIDPIDPLDQVLDELCDTFTTLIEPDAAPRETSVVAGLYPSELCEPATQPFARPLLTPTHWFKEKTVQVPMPWLRGQLW